MCVPAKTPSLTSSPGLIDVIDLKSNFIKRPKLLNGFSVLKRKNLDEIRYFYNNYSEKQKKPKIDLYDCKNRIEKDIKEKDSSINEILKYFNNATLEHYEDIFNSFKEKNDHRSVLKNIDYNQVSFFSFLNFIRYYVYLDPYFENCSYEVNIYRENIYIIFTSKSELKTILKLEFKANGLVDFLSLDNDVNDDEKLMFAIEGNFSSSDKIHKSYKIKSILRILDIQKE